MTHPGRRLLVQGLVGGATALQRAARLLAASGAGALTRATLEESIRRRRAADPAARGYLGADDRSIDEELILFSGRFTLGEALRRAKLAALQADPQWAPTVVEGFNLMGDPALRLPRSAPPQ